MTNSTERQIYLLDFTVAVLLRRKRKNALLAALFTLIVFVLASVMFLTQSLRREASIILENAPEMIIQRSVGNRHELLPVGYLEKVREIMGVDSVRSRLWGYYYDPVVGANYTLMVAEDHQQEPGKIIIGAGISRTALAFPGDTMEFRAFDGSIISLEVQAILPPELELVTSDLMLTTEEDFRRLFGIPDEYVTDLVVRVKDPHELSDIAMKVSERLPETRTILREDILRTYDHLFVWRDGMMACILTGALLALIILAWDKASGLSQEEKKEIGILKAIGWETSDVLLLKFWEGLVISLSSFLAGIILAYAHVFLADFVLFEPVLKGWGVLYPSFRLTPSISPFQVGILFFLTVVPYTAATMIPSWYAASIEPDTVMRA